MMPKGLQNDERAKWANNKPDEFVEQAKRLADFRAKATRNRGGRGRAKACIDVNPPMPSSPIVMRVGGHKSDMHPLRKTLAKRGWDVVGVEGDESENDMSDAIEVMRRASDARLAFAVWVDSDGELPEGHTRLGRVDLCRVAMASGDVAWTGSVSSARVAERPRSRRGERLVRDAGARVLLLAVCVSW